MSSNVYPEYNTIKRLMRELACESIVIAAAALEELTDVFVNFNLRYEFWESKYVPRPEVGMSILTIEPGVNEVPLTGRHACVYDLLSTADGFST